MNDQSPTIGATTAPPSPGCSTSAGALNTCLISVVSDRNTSFGKLDIRCVKRLP
jgi:hypothetical protein